MPTAKKIELAREFFAEHKNHQNTWFILEDIYNIDLKSLGTFDVIFMKDVIEHIPNQEKFMAYLKSFLSPSGVVFFALDISE